MLDTRRIRAGFHDVARPLVVTARLLVDANTRGQVGWRGHKAMQVGPACALLGEYQLVIFGDAQAIVFTLVADQDFLTALE